MKNTPNPNNDGGAAFPRATEQTVQGFPGTLEGERGMTLRDYLAAKAMQGFCSSSDQVVCPNERKEDVMKWRKEYWATSAEIAYMVADAMLVAREKQKPGLS